MANREFDDSLDDIFDADVKLPQRPVPPLAMKTGADYEPAVNRLVVEKCQNCRGAGLWQGRQGYPCFKCKGRGEKVYKTSTEHRARQREAAAEKRSEVRTQYAEDFKAEIAWVEAEARRQSERMARTGKIWDFPGKMASAFAQYGCWTDRQVVIIRDCMQRDAARRAEWVSQRTACQAEVDASKIEAAFASARAKAVRPGMRGIWAKPLHLRAQGQDYRFQPGSEGSQWQGLIFVKKDKRKMGYIKAGVFHPHHFECSDADKAAIVEACNDPAQAAIAYGKAWSTCAVCGLTLTNDESIERGIGPVCYGKMGW